MPAFFALGTGFMQGATQKLDDIQDERKKNRQMAMEVWVKDTLPRVRAAQAKDEAFVASVNGMMNDDYYKGNPALAYYSKKWQERTGKDEMTFRSYAATNELPPEVKAAAEAELGKHFNIDPTSSQLSWKSQVPAVQPTQAQPGQKSSLYDKIMGRGNMQSDATKGVKQGAAMAGVDPNASTTARSDTMSVPGGFQSKDPEKEKLKAMGINLAAQNFESIRNQQGFLKTLMTGDTATLEKAIADPKFTISREEAKADKFNQAFRMAATERYLNGDFGKDNDLMRALLQGNSQKIVEGVTRGLKTEEEKLSFAIRMKQIEVAAGSLDSPEAFKMMRKAGILDKLNIPEANLALMEKEADAAIARKEDIMDRIMREQFNAKNSEREKIAPRSDVGTAAPEAVASPDTTAAPPATNPIEDAMNSPEGFILKAKPEPAAETNTKENPYAVRAGTVSQFGTVEDIRSFNDPVRLLKDASQRAKSGKDKDKKQARLVEVAKNITVTPGTADKIINDEEYGNEWNKMLTEYVEPLLQEFNSISEAQNVVHPFGLAKVNGNIVVIPPKKQ